MSKVSIRFYKDHKVRALWDEERNHWWFLLWQASFWAERSVLDIVGAINQQEFYFVVEIKGTNDITDKRALTPHEIARIQCAVKHFRSLGIEAVYKAPIREYSKFEKEATKTINGQANE